MRMTEYMLMKLEENGQILTAETLIQLYNKKSL